MTVVLTDNDLRADRHTFVKIGHIFIAHSNTARRHGLADGPGLIGPVDPIERGAEI